MVKRIIMFPRFSENVISPILGFGKLWCPSIFLEVYHSDEKLLYGVGYHGVTSLLGLGGASVPKGACQVTTVKSELLAKPVLNNY